DGAFFKVVTKGKIAVHLEERAVTGGLTDFVNIGRTHTLLDAGRPRPRCWLLPQHVWNEGNHPAMVNIVDGSGEIKEALGTISWPRSEKNFSQRRRISAVCMVCSNSYHENR